MQDKIPPRPYSEIVSRVESELGKPVDDLFQWFDKKPVASASLAQVHEARLKDGRKVAVKVQYMDIEQIVHQD